MTPEPDEYAAIADLYDFVDPYATRADVAFYVDAAVDTGGPVLEVGCGTGRVLLPTARAGIAITGLDASASMLAVCRERLASEPDEVRARTTLAGGDMRTFDLGRTFRLATIPFRPFQHLLTVDDQLACLGAIRRHLAPGGRLVFDLFDPMLELLVNGPFDTESDPEPAFTTPDGRRVLRRHRSAPPDRARQIGSHELIYDVTHPDGRRERLVHAFQLRYAFRFEIEHLVVRAGFAVERIYGGFDRSPFGSRYPGELIVVAAVASRS